MGAPPRLSRVDRGRPLDLLELGSSAGLNLIWDRYRYVYSSGEWGTGALLLRGDDRTPPPPHLLGREVTVQRRRGVDLHPVDVTTERGARLLRAFVWADQSARLERLDEAIALARCDPPQLLAGDYVEALPSLLRNRRDGAQLIVFQTASTMYLGRGQHERVRGALSEAARDEPLLYLTAIQAPDLDGYSLEVERYPDGQSQRLAVFDFHGEWLDWSP